MPSVTLTSLVGSGGDFKVTTATVLFEVPSGVTGTLATITPPAGKKVSLTTLVAGVAQSGISVEVNGSTVIATNTLNPANSPTPIPNTYCIGQMIPATIENITGDVDQPITITKDAGNTTTVIRYAYAYGD